jgi:hypothetical protein
MKKRWLGAVVSMALAGSVWADTIQLPYSSPDSAGNQWMLYYQGQLQMQGNQPVFSQAAMITVNGQQPRQNNQQGNLDEKAKEVTIQFDGRNGPNPGAFKHSRRVKFDEETGIVRVIDIFENTQDREQSLNVMMTTNTNYGVNSAQIVDDPKKKGSQLAWAADTGAGRAAMSMFAGKRSKVLPNIRYNQGNNQVSANYTLKLPKKEKIAIVSWHGSFDSADAATKWVEEARESKMIADLPGDLKKIIVNVSEGGTGSVGGKDVLRGDATDIIELRGGDQIRGDLKVASYKLNTAFGTVELPATKIAGILSVGEFRVRNLLVTSEGEIFGGDLEEKTIPIQLSSGQTTQVPLAQIARIGYRTNGVEQPEWTFTNPMVFLRSGERAVIKPPTDAIEFVSRYGVLKLTPEQVACVVLKTASNVHELYLSDGSKLTGLVSRPQWPLKLVSASGDATVPFPLAAISRVQLKPLAEDVGAGQPTLAMQGGDIVCTRIEGELKLSTAFDTLTLNANEIKSLVRADEGLPDVQVTMFDGSTFRGTLTTPSLKAKLGGTTALEVPVAALQEYFNPQPFPSASLVTKAQEGIKNLNAEDWKAREAAEVSLIALGSSVVSVLEESLASQPPEVQQRLQSVIKRLKKDVAPAPSRLAPPPGLD